MKSVFQLSRRSVMALCIVLSLGCYFDGPETDDPLPQEFPGATKVLPSSRKQTLPPDKDIPPDILRDMKIIQGEIEADDDSKKKGQDAGEQSGAGDVKSPESGTEKARDKGVESADSNTKADESK